VPFEATNQYLVRIPCRVADPMNKLMEHGSGQPIARAIRINFEAKLKCLKPEGRNYDKGLVAGERIGEAARVNDLTSLIVVGGLVSLGCQSHDVTCASIIGSSTQKPGSDTSLAFLDSWDTESIPRTSFHFYTLALPCVGP